MKIFANQDVMTNARFLVVVYCYNILKVSFLKIILYSCVYIFVTSSLIMCTFRVTVNYCFPVFFSFLFFSFFYIF